MKNCRRSLVAVGVMALASAFTVAPAAAQGYGGLSLGISTSPDFNDQCDAAKSIPSSDATCTKSPMGFKLFGGYQFNPNFAAEGGYYSTGDFKVSSAAAGLSAKVSATSFFGQAVGIMPIQQSFSLFGKIGMHFWKFKADDPTGTASNDSGSDIVFGVGGKFAVSRTSAIRVEYEQFKASSGGDSFVVNFLSAGYEMKF